MKGYKLFPEHWHVRANGYANRFQYSFYGLASNVLYVLAVHCGASGIPDSLQKDLFRQKLDIIHARANPIQK